MCNTIYRAIITPFEGNNVDELTNMGFEFMKNELPADNVSKCHYLVLFQHEKRNKSILFSDVFNVEDFIDNVTYPCKLEETTAVKVSNKLIAWLQHKDGG